MTGLRISSQIGAVLTFFVTVSAAQENGTPVPQDWVSSHPIEGETLTVSSLNFSIRAPHGRHWRQLQLSDIKGAKATAFIAEGSDEAPQYSVIVSQKASTTLTQADVDDFVRGMAESLPAGWMVLDIQTQHSTSPTAGSTRFRTKIKTPDDGDLYQYGYLVPGRRSYILVTYERTEVEPLAFSTFAKSLTFLDSSQSEASQKTADQSEYNPTNALPALLLLVAIIGAFLDRGYLKAGGVRPTTREKTYLCVSVAIAALALVGLGLIGGSARDIGRATALLAVVVFSIWEFGRFRVRRLNPVNSTMQPKPSNWTEEGAQKR